MTEEKTISVYAIVHKEFCLSSDDGNEVFRRLSKVMGEGFVTILSFDKIKIDDFRLFKRCHWQAIRRI